MNSKDGARRSRRSCLVIAVALSFTLSASICSAQAADRSEGATGDGKVATPGLDSAPAAPGADASAAGVTPAASAPGDSGNAGGASQAAQASAADKDDKAPQLPNVDEAFSNLTQSHQAIEPAPYIRGTIEKTVDGTPPTLTQTAAALTATTTSALFKTDKAAAPVTINTVIQTYKSGKYRDALTMIAGMKPSDVTHYWSGLCYQGQNQLHQAGLEFQWVASYSKDPQLRFNAQRALLVVNRYAQGRTYAGQGNTFNRPISSPARGGGGSGRG